MILDECDVVSRRLDEAGTVLGKGRSGEGRGEKGRESYQGVRELASEVVVGGKEMDGANMSPRISPGGTGLVEMAVRGIGSKVSLRGRKAKARRKDIRKSS